LFHFLRKADQKPPTLRLASSIHEPLAEAYRRLNVDFYSASVQNAVNKGFLETSRLPTCRDIA